MNKLKEINQAGNLIHTADLDNLQTIMEYGLISLSHENNWTIINPKLERCPCGQDLSNGLVRYLGKSSTLYFHSLGPHAHTSPRPENLCLKNLYWPIRPDTFGVFIQPEDLLDSFRPSWQERFVALMGDRNTRTKIAETDYWKRVYRQAKDMGQRKIFDREFKISSCIPWTKFSGLIIDSTHKGEVLRLMGNFQTGREKPIYDVQGNVLYSP